MAAGSAPDLCEPQISLCRSGRLWGLEKDDLNTEVLAIEPEDRRLTADERTIDDICLALAEIIAAKTPFTYQHSNGVANAAVDIGRCFGFGDTDLKRLRRAGLLQDIGKLGISNAILEKPGNSQRRTFGPFASIPFIPTRFFAAYRLSLTLVPMPQLIMNVSTEKATGWACVRTTFTPCANSCSG